GRDDLGHEELGRVREADDARRVERRGDLTGDDRAVALRVDARAAADEALRLRNLVLQVGQRAVDARVDDGDLDRVGHRRRGPRVERVVHAEIPLLAVVRVRRRECRSRRGPDEGSRHGAEHRNPQPVHYPTVALRTRIRTDPAASVAVASRYWVVTFGLTATWNVPVATALMRCHGPPLPRFCRTTPRTPRTTPWSVTLVPAAILGFGDGGWSERTPTLNHVERSPSAAAAFAPVTDDTRATPPESELSLR